MLNEAKTEAIVLCAPCCKAPPTVDTINVCGRDITPQLFVRDIGVFVDNTLCMLTHKSLARVRGPVSNSTRSQKFENA